MCIIISGEKSKFVYFCYKIVSWHFVFFLFCRSECACWQIFVKLDCLHKFFVESEINRGFWKFSQDREKRRWIKDMLWWKTEKETYIELGKFLFITLFRICQALNRVSFCIQTAKNQINQHIWSVFPLCFHDQSRLCSKDSDQSAWRNKLCL